MSLEIWLAPVLALALLVLYLVAAMDAAGTDRVAQAGPEVVVPAPTPARAARHGQWQAQHLARAWAPVRRTAEVEREEER